MSKQQSVMRHRFSEVPKAEIPRSSFDRSHGYKTTFDAGKLIPIFVDEVLPGDSFNLKMQGFARLATPIYPIMDNIFLETFFFFIPNRLVWDNWQKFCGEQDDPDDSTDFIIPVVTHVPSTGQLYDYIGLPLGCAQTINALHLRSYNLVFNEWFRDQNLQDSLPVSKGDGPDSAAAYNIVNRGKRHDYFTSCLPWPQKGESVDISLTGDAPVLGLGTRAGMSWVPGPYSVWEADGTTSSYQEYQSTAGSFPDYLYFEKDQAYVGNIIPKIRADLSNVSAVTINSLRQAFQVQKLLERDARGGTRYTEVVKAHFGVTSPDARLQRTEYLGGGSSMINIAAVPQTSETVTTPQGNLAAYGTASVSNHGFTKSFTEHGVLLGLVNARADLTYQQGQDRMWTRQSRYDFFWPALSHIGEQAVLCKEIYCDGGPEDDDVFGYQERFAEYRYKPSRITGLFRSAAATGLDAWHLSQDFATRPILSDTFIQDDPPIDRVIAVPTEPHFLLDCYFQLRCARPMPLYGVPGFTDRF